VDISKVDRIIFTSDFLKVDDRSPDRLKSPQNLNIRWIATLLGPVFEGLLKKDVQVFLEADYPDPLSRIAIYRSLFREFSTAGWASLYEGLGDDVIERRIAERFSGSLVISYEAPPYLVKILTRNKIPFIDLNVHPVRFLPDYLFGIRTNIPKIQKRLPHLSVPETVMSDFARVSLARTTRVYQNRPFMPGASVFFGQISVDSSLIANGMMADREHVSSALLHMKANSSEVYYKAHPHAEDVPGLKAFVQDLGVKWLESNAYDVLGAPELQGVGGMSSGVLHEAGYFGVQAKRFLNAPAPFASKDQAPSEAAAAMLYLPMNPAIVSHMAWRYLLSVDNTVPELSRLDPCLGAVKYSLSMTWGR
jgi:hypothetical protein